MQKEKETSFLTLCMAIFVLTATSLFEIWTPAWSSATASRFHGGFFSFLARMVLFFSSLGLYFFLFTKDFSSAFDFSMSKDSVSKELPRVNFVKCAM